MMDSSDTPTQHKRGCARRPSMASHSQSAYVLDRLQIAPSCATALATAIFAIIHKPASPAKAVGRDSQ